MKTKFYRGFTILELMITVAILGVLASIAIPTYINYITRAQVSEAMYLLGGLKKPLIEYYTTWDVWASVDAINGAKSGTYTESVVSGHDNGDLYYVEAKMRGPGTLENMQLRMTYNVGTRQWKCTTVGTTNPIPDKYLSSACK